MASPARFRLGSVGLCSLIVSEMHPWQRRGVSRALNDIQCHATYVPGKVQTLKYGLVLRPPEESTPRFRHSD